VEKEGNEEGDVVVEKAPAEKEGGSGHSPSSVQEERTEVTVAEEMATPVEEVVEEESMEEASQGDEEENWEGGSQGVPQEGAVATVLINSAVAASQDMYPSSTVLFRIIKDLQKRDKNLIVGNTDQEQFEDMYRLSQLSELDREAELAKCHADLKAHQEMEAIQEQQRQVDHMRAAVAEQTKRREMEAL
jgi:hypothetical protein